MSPTSSDGSGGGSTFWTALKVVLFIIVALFLLSIVFRILRILFVPALIVGAIYLLYRFFTKDKSGDDLSTSAPLLLESDLEEDDELERQLRELEAQIRSEDLKS